jgi:c-di-GMP-binding flagellar brake protein YcgR
MASQANGAGEAAATAEELPQRAERRSYPRFAVDCPATVTTIAGGGVIHGQLTDLSQGGCRMATAERASVGLLTRVEVRFSLRGMAFQIAGVTVGTRSAKSFAVRFLEMSARRAEALAELMAEIESDPEGPAQPARAVESPLAQVAAVPKAAEPAEAEAIAQESMAPEPAAPEVALPEVELRAERPRTPKVGERRVHDRHAVDTRVTLTLVRGAITMKGSILNLSQGGCRLRTDERFNVGIYTRVEAEFYLHGLPFRLAGVSQAIVDKNTIGVRFLDMSERKRAQLTELILEIEEKLGMDGEGNLREG